MRRIVHRHLPLVTAAAALCAAAPAVLSGPPAQAAAGRSVVLRNIAFSPSKLTVARGTSVTFRWDDGDTNHNVTSRGSKRFPSSPTKGHGSYSVRFAKAGVYRYVCTLHLGMSGRIAVK